MQIRTPVIAVALVAMISGCGDGSPSSEEVVLKGPHLGTTLQLPGKQGYVELINEPEVTDRAHNTPTSIVAYYLEPDAKTALRLVPTNVNFTIDSGDGGVNVPSATRRNRFP